MTRVSYLNMPSEHQGLVANQARDFGVKKSGYRNKRSFRGILIVDQDISKKKKRWIVQVMSITIHVDRSVWNIFRHRSIMPSFYAWYHLEIQDVVILCSNRILAHLKIFKLLIGVLKLFCAQFLFRAFYFVIMSGHQARVATS